MARGSKTGQDHGRDATRSEAEVIPLYVIAAVLDAGFGSIFVLLAEIRSLFDLTSFGIGMIGGAGFVSAFAAQVGLSRFADRGHARAMVGIGVGIAASSMLVLAYAASLEAFVLGRTLFGLGQGVLIPAARRLGISRDPARAGEFLGRMGAAQVSGFLAGPMFGSLMNQFFGLRSTFLLTFVLLLACGPLVLRIRGDAGVVDAGRRLPVFGPLLENRRIQALLCAAIGYYGSFGVYEATWAIFLADLGASQLVIGLNMTLFALPVMLVSPFAGTFAARRGSLRVTVIAIGVTLPIVASYGFLDSVLVLTCVMMVQAVADAVVVPASQLAVAEASGENLAAGQGLFNATGLAAGGAVALGSGALYDAAGPAAVFGAVAGLMTLSLLVTVVVARRELFAPPRASQVGVQGSGE